MIFFKRSKFKWRVRSSGRDAIYYAERQDGKWRRLEIGGEMLFGGKDHPDYAIYFPSIQEWEKGPKWARGRRKEILTRIKSKFRIPRYEYVGEDVLDDDDYQLLIKAGGGISDRKCRWHDCEEFALNGKELCVVHLNRHVS